MGTQHEKIIWSQAQTRRRAWTRQRQPRRDRGQVRFNVRDLAVLAWIGAQYAVRLDTLQHLLGVRAEQPTREAGRVQASAARRVLGRWAHAGLIERHKLLAQEPVWIWLKRQGLRQVGLGYRPWRPALALLRHLHTVNQVRLMVEAEYGALQAWRSERHLRHLYAGEADFHVPDGEIVTTAGDTIAVEVELTRKARRRSRRIVRRLAHQYARVWFFVTPETRPLITELTRDRRDLFRLYPLENVLR